MDNEHGELALELETLPDTDTRTGSSSSILEMPRAANASSAGSRGTWLMQATSWRTSPSMCSRYVREAHAQSRLQPVRGLLA